MEENVKLGRRTYMEAFKRSGFYNQITFLHNVFKTFILAYGAYSYIILIGNWVVRKAYDWLAMPWSSDNRQSNAIMS